jgi:radical SAM superfamily enzyme with C-terminal helix-hairpin-helix motif
MNATVKFRFLPAAFLLTALLGCNSQQSPQELKEKTARETATMKRDARAVAEGIREGWSRDKPLDLNSASKDDLMALPGMTSAEADRVIDGRPYREPDELLSRHILSKEQYDKISDRIVAKR